METWWIVSLSPPQESEVFTVVLTCCYSQYLGRNNQCRKSLFVAWHLKHSLTSYHKWQHKYSWHFLSFQLLFNQWFYVQYQKTSSELSSWRWSLIIFYRTSYSIMMCYSNNCKYIRPQTLGVDARQWSSLKSQTQKRCEAELSRVAAILEIMSECLNGSVVEMTANQYHIQTQKRWIWC